MNLKLSYYEVNFISESLCSVLRVVLKVSNDSVACSVSHNNFETHVVVVRAA